MNGRFQFQIIDAMSATAVVAVALGAILAKNGLVLLLVPQLFVLALLRPLISYWKERRLKVLGRAIKAGAAIAGLVTFAIGGWVLITSLWQRESIHFELFVCPLCVFVLGEATLGALLGAFVGGLAGEVYD